MLTTFLFSFLEWEFFWKSWCRKTWANSAVCVFLLDLLTLPSYSFFTSKDWYEIAREYIGGRSMVLFKEFTIKDRCSPERLPDSKSTVATFLMPLCMCHGQTPFKKWSLLGLHRHLNLWTTWPESVYCMKHHIIFPFKKKLRCASITDQYIKNSPTMVTGCG